MTEPASLASQDELVRLAQRGDALALAELMDLLTGYVGRICGPIALQDGPDAAQEALIVILRSIKQLRDPATLYGWVRVIAVREAVRVARQAKRAVPIPDSACGCVANPAADPELAVDIADVLARLTPEHRAVLMLRDLHGIDEQTAGRMLAVPPGTIRTRLFRARRSFRQEWQS